MKFKISMEHKRGHNEGTMSGDRLQDWLRDLIVNVGDKSDFLIHLEIDRVE